MQGYQAEFRDKCLSGSMPAYFMEMIQIKYFDIGVRKMEKQLKAFFEFLEQDKKLSSKTLQSYQRDLKQFRRYIEGCEVFYFPGLSVSGWFAEEIL